MEGARDVPGPDGLALGTVLVVIPVLVAVGGGVVRGRWLAAAVVSAVGVGALVASPTTTPAAAAPTCVNAQLQRAPVVSGDVRDDGSPVAVTKDRRGKQVPIVLVGGAGERGTVSATDRTGPFAHPVDLVAGTATVPEDPRSLLGELQNLPGTDVFTFDYTTWADAWVDDDHLGPALGSALACLRQATGERAIVVTASTGSLIARWALTHPTKGVADPASLVSTVVTFGAPDSGSTLGLLAPGGVAAAERAGLDQAALVAATVRLLAAGCAAASGDPADGSVCDQLDRTVPLATGDLGRALIAGSSQLASLGSWPQGVAVHDLHASTALTLPPHGWFGSEDTTDTVAVGDLFDLTTALPRAPKPAASCALTLAATADASSWQLAATDSDDPGRPVATATGPCLAGDLTRTTELVASARSLVLADLFRRQPLVAKDLLSAPIPSLCDWWPAGHLTNGTYVGPNPDPNGYAQPPTLVTQDTYRRGPFVALGDLDGDGIGDAAGIVNCNKGGVSWPDYLLMWGSGLRLLGAFMLGDVLGGARGGTTAISYKEGSIVVDSIDEREWDAACCASGLAKVTLAWDGKAVTAKNVQHLQGPDDITATSMGAVHLGMSGAQVAALGFTGGPPSVYGCVQYYVPGKPYVTVDPRTDEVVLIYPPDLDSFGPHTWPQGIGVGATVAEVQAAYRGKDVEVRLGPNSGYASSGVVVHDDGAYMNFYVDATNVVDAIEISSTDSFGDPDFACE